jgi:hypothetical protein
MAGGEKRPVMTSERYQFDYDAGGRFLRLTLTGLWDEAVLAAFVREAAELRNRVERSGHRTDEGRILIDLTGYPVQPKNITEQIAALLPTFGERAGRVAVVRSTSALQNLQVQRLLALDKVRMFASFDEALAWLSESRA